jgi:hypothetical protein
MRLIEPKSKDIKDIKDIKDRLEVNFGEVGFPSMSQGIPGCDSCPEQVGAGYSGKRVIIWAKIRSFFILYPNPLTQVVLTSSFP